MTSSTKSKKQASQAEATLPSPDAEPGSKRKTGAEPVKSPEAKRHKPEENGVENKTERDSNDAANDDEHGAEETPDDRADSTPSNILEKGLIYFFFRARVGLDNDQQPSDVSDVARSWFLLRPIARDAKLGHDAIADAGISRLCAIPKKTLPQTGAQKWTAFVEKAGASFQELKQDFLAGEMYDTQTAGQRKTHAATPFAEGVYIITTTGRESHLVYLLTLPEKLDEVQHEMGLKQRGSFGLSTKNPETKGPAYAELPEKPKYPDDVQEQFRGLRWMPTQPVHLDHPNTQFLLIGDSSGVGKATEPQKQDMKENKDEPLEELEKLEEEDMHRMSALPGDEADKIFADLQADAADYPKLQTTF